MHDRLLELLLPAEGDEATIIQSGLTMAAEETPANKLTILVEPELKELINEMRDFLER